MEKLIGQLDELERDHSKKLSFDGFYHKRHNIIKSVLNQQRQMYDNSGSVSERIVSIDKHYIRPIVRGKEIKAVEFGAKVNLIQVDGLNFVEHIAFKAFNEGTRGISSIQYAQVLFRKRVTHFAADAIYATNKTRKYCSSHTVPIYTSFVPKGKKSKDEKQRKSITISERSKPEPNKQRYYGYSLEYIRQMLSDWLKGNLVSSKKQHNQIKTSTV